MRYGAEDDDLERSTTNVMAFGLVLMLAFILVFPLYRVFEPASRDDARATHVESLAHEGENLWGFNCASCHGETGEGGIGPALNAKEFLQAATDEQIELLIAVGVPGSAMGAYSQDFAGPLTSAQIRAVATYIRSLEDDAPSNPNWRAGTPAEAAASSDSDADSANGADSVDDSE